MYIHPYYLDQSGRMIEYDNLCSHVGIAIRYINSDSKLKEEFSKSGIESATDFLVKKKGFIQVTEESGNGWYNNKIVFSASMMKPRQKQLIMGFLQEGYTYDNVDVVSDSVVKRFYKQLDDIDK